jgi:hypothetical protein
MAKQLYGLWTGCLGISKVKRSVRMSGQAKHVVFRYNDDDKDTDVEVDILGDLPDYAVGDIVTRRGKSWRIVRVVSEQALIGSQSVPAYIVTVTDKD